MYGGHSIISHCYTRAGILSYGTLSINQFQQWQEVRQNQGLGPALGPQEPTAAPGHSFLLCVRLQLPLVPWALAPAGTAAKAWGTPLSLLGSLKQGLPSLTTIAVSGPAPCSNSQDPGELGLFVSLLPGEFLSRGYRDFGPFCNFVSLL